LDGDSFECQFFVGLLHQFPALVVLALLLYDSLRLYYSSWVILDGLNLIIGMTIILTNLVIIDVVNFHFLRVLLQLNLEPGEQQVSLLLQNEEETEGDYGQNEVLERELHGLPLEAVENADV